MLQGCKNWKEPDSVTYISPKKKKEIKGKKDSSTEKDMLEVSILD